MKLIVYTRPQAFTEFIKLVRTIVGVNLIEARRIVDRPDYPLTIEFQRRNDSVWCGISAQSVREGMKALSMLQSYTLKYEVVDDEFPPESLRARVEEILEPADSRYRQRVQADPRFVAAVRLLADEIDALRER